MSHKTHMHDNRESHNGVVPAKRSNEGRGGPKEIAEGRPLTKENAEEPNPCIAGRVERDQRRRPPSLSVFCAGRLKAERSHVS